MLYSQESGSIRSPINAEAFPLVICHPYSYPPYVVVSMRMRYMCAFRSLLRRRLRRRRERERERRARESVHRRRLCDQESARLQRPPRKGRPARRRVRDRAI